MPEPARDTIYIDLEDEITNVIDKVMDSSKDIVALVLPKRASIFQSTVNMKLLKRKSEEVGKKVVLVTSEASLLPLAGGIGLFVARTLNSKPEIPSAPKLNQSIIEASEADIIMSDELDKELNPNNDLSLAEARNVPISQLADNKPSPVKTQLDKDLDTISLDNTIPKKPDEPSVEQKLSKKAKKEAKKKDKKLKIPNFKKFKVIMIILIILLILIGLLYLIFVILPSASVNIKTNASNVNTNIQFTLDPTTQTLNQASNIVPAKLVKLTKTYTATANATGQQNNGQKATGSVVFSDCVSQPPFPPSSIPAGIGIVQNNLTYITQSAASFNNPSQHQNNPNCVNYNSNQVNIIAQQGGSSYNTSGNGTSFSDPGQSGVSANGDASGGTDNIVTVVSQNDITNASNKINVNNNNAQNSLSSQLYQAGYDPIELTFSASQPNTTENNAVGTVANSVSVTETISYSLYGVKKAYLITLLDNNISAQTGSSQNILSTGLNHGNFSYTNGNTAPLDISLQTTAIVGPNIHINSIKKQIEGKNKTQIQQIISQNSNVNGVKVSFSPFYVNTSPSNPSKINVKVAKPSKTNAN